MPRPILIALLLLIGLACSAGCDRPPEQPGQSAQNKRDVEGQVWRSLVGNLQSAANDDAKVRLLEKFVAENPEHPDFSEAKRQLDEIKSSPDSVAKELIAKLAQEAIEEGQPKALTALLASESVRQFNSRVQRDELGAVVKVPTTEGLEEVSHSVFLHPLVLRGHARRALKQHANDKIEKRCDRKCVNEAINGILSKSIGAPLFREEGKLNPDAVGPLLEKTWLMPDDEVLGVPAKALYSIFAPTFRAYARVGYMMKTANPTAAAGKILAMDRKEIPGFYRTWTAEAGLAEMSGLPPKDVAAISGWWLRRYGDGTSALFDAYVLKVVEAYDPALSFSE